MPEPYTLVRSKRKTIALIVEPDGSLTVRAPQRMPAADIDRFVDAHADWIAKKQQACEKNLPPPTEEELARLRQWANAVLPVRVAYWAERMGVAYTQLRITSARHRYGSCSSNGHLCFSCLLMRSPAAAVDYVVVHELAHLRHMNHSPQFYALIEQYLPDWRERQKMLVQSR